jgi:alpha-ketoglutarate-dependent taurine dioxygenase
MPARRAAALPPILERMSAAPAHRSFREQAVHYFTRPHTRVPDAPIDSPAAWRGADLRDRADLWRVRLEAPELEELERGLETIEQAGLPMDAVDRDRLPLPRLAPKIARWRAELMHGRGFLLVSGLPVDRWGEARSALAFWALGHHLGIPGAQNPAGELLGHVRDYDEQSDSPHVRLYRTTSDIGFHCDAADVVGLLCLQTARRGGESRIASSVAVWNALFAEDPEAARDLFTPFAHDLRGEHRPGSPGHAEIPPCRLGEDGLLRTFYHGEYFRSVERLPEVGPLAPARKALLDRYDALAGSPDFRLDMRLERGDLQLVSNHTIVHARTGYEDAPDPAHKRHLLRLWLSLHPD